MLHLKRPYKRLNLLIENETFEPLISWGFRMALSGTLPIIWGLATGRIMDAVWMTLTAEAVTWVELKGAFSWRVRTLLAGAALAVLFSLAGTLTGNNLWLSVACMFVVGFVATLLKNIGDRASGLAICVYLLFILCNAYPATEYNAVRHRFILVCAGAAWPVFVGVAISLLMPAEQPFRRQIALVWRAISLLVKAVANSGLDKDAQTNPAALYQEEKDVRTAMNNSYQFYGRMAYQTDEKDNRQYQLAMVRKIAGMVSVNVVAMGGEMAHINVAGLDETLRVKAATLFSALKSAVGRISVFIITLGPEEKLLAVSHINRLKKLASIIRQYPLPAGEQQTNAIKRILQLTDRTARLLENALLRIEQMGDDIPVYRSYSFIKTLFILSPKYLFSDIKLVFNLNTFNTRYALRSAIAATVALFIYKWFGIGHGYWLPFSVMIIIQPYFGATFTKAIARVGGTLAGGIAASLLLHLPVSLHINEGILFLTFILMVYYIRKKYSVAVFFITLNLVLLFHIESAYNDRLMITRALCTAGGALLAVVSGFALFPTWDKKWLPVHLADAIKGNYDYFTATFYTAKGNVSWTRNKRAAESKNSNVFDSFNRYMQDPGKGKSELYYDLITCCVRISRELNNIQMEEDEKKQAGPKPPGAEQQKTIDECLELFNTVMDHLPHLDPKQEVKLVTRTSGYFSPFGLNEIQLISLEKLGIELKTMEGIMVQ
jgi:uncharacterized membrane protein YccC